MGATANFWTFKTFGPWQSLSSTRLIGALAPTTRNCCEQIISMKKEKASSSCTAKKMVCAHSVHISLRCSCQSRTGYDDDDSIDMELNGDDGAEGCNVLDFDEDDEGNNQFPFENGPIDDEDARNAQIFEVLKRMMNSVDVTDDEVKQQQDMPEMTQQDEKDEEKQKIEPINVDVLPLAVDIVRSVSVAELNETTLKYMRQMSSIDNTINKDADLTMGFAIGDKHNNNYISNLVDAFTNDAAKHFADTEEELLLKTWAGNNVYMRRLKDYDEGKRDLMVSAMTTFSTRIMPRLRYTSPTFKIRDSLFEIAEYVTSIPLFIATLMNQKYNRSVPPFQFDLVIAVKDVVSVDGDEELDSDDDDDEDDEDERDVNSPQALDPTEDHVGHVQKGFQQYPVAYHPRTDYDIPGTEVVINKISRGLMHRYNDFRSMLRDAKNGGSDGGDKDDEAKDGGNGKWDSNRFDDKTYPRKRRFCTFIDRRKNKPTRSEEEKKDRNHQNVDQMTFFEPPEGSNAYPEGHVPEIGFEFVRQCIIPNAAKNITARDAVCGQLITFMFSVEASDQIKCYVIWNGETMRFHGDHIWQVLPYMFEETEQNTQFVENKEQRARMAEKFDKGVCDAEFERFQKSINIRPR